VSEGRNSGQVMPGAGLVDWGRQAACRSADPELFFPVSGRGAAEPVVRAKALCGARRVRRQCLRMAAVKTGRPASVLLAAPAGRGNEEYADGTGAVCGVFEIANCHFERAAVRQSKRLS
jgi:WhiB family redox-sensing transcriptional regulator